MSKQKLIGSRSPNLRSHHRYREHWHWIIPTNIPTEVWKRHKYNLSYSHLLFLTTPIYHYLNKFNMYIELRVINGFIRLALKTF